MPFSDEMVFNASYLKEALKSFAPYGVVAYRLALLKNLRLKDFYERQLGIRRGQLVYDVGANVGDKVLAFRMLGCRVVAFEPQQSCLTTLRSKFGKDDEVTILPIGLANKSGRLGLHVANASHLASFSEEFISHARSHGRFGGATWQHTCMVAVSTLDEQIERFGIPDFIKIDVEGFESLVLEGLSASVEKLCFEWTPERTGALTDCVRRCLQLELTEFNISMNESNTLNFKEWVSSQDLLRLTELLSQNISIFGDVYARRARR